MPFDTFRRLIMYVTVLNFLIKFTAICIMVIQFVIYKAKWSKYPNHKSELVSHLDIDNFEIFDTQTWTRKQRCDQVLAGSKHQLSIIIHTSCLCINNISQ